MAVSGAGGWIPSCGVYLRGGEVRMQSIMQNKPRTAVELDLAVACARILAGEIVQIDMRGSNYVTLKRLLEESLERSTT